MQFLAKRTRCITNLIYFPFVALAFLVLSRSPLFDDFVTPWTIVITQALSVFLVIASVASLRRAAENARTVARAHLKAQIIAAKETKTSTKGQPAWKCFWSRSMA